MATSRTTYKYHYKLGNRIVHSGITEDIDRREAEHRRHEGWERGHIKQVGVRTTPEAAQEWEEDQRSQGKQPDRNDNSIPAAPNPDLLYAVERKAGDTPAWSTPDPCWSAFCPPPPPAGTKSPAACTSPRPGPFRHRTSRRRAVLSNRPRTGLLGSILATVSRTSAAVNSNACLPALSSATTPISAVAKLSGLMSDGSRFGLRSRCLSQISIPGSSAATARFLTVR